MDLIDKSYGYIRSTGLYILYLNRRSEPKYIKSFRKIESYYDSETFKLVLVWGGLCLGKVYV